MATTPKTDSMPMNMGQLEKMLDEYLVKKAPALPANFKEILVKFAPYLAIIGVVLGVPALLTLLGASALLSSSMYYAAYGAGLGYMYYVSIAFMIASLVLEGLAIPGLFARKKSAWNLMFYATLVSALSSLVNQSWGGLIIGTLISLYLLFQVRSYYK
jgi:hypothetical protein